MTAYWECDAPRGSPMTGYWECDAPLTIKEIDEDREALNAFTVPEDVTLLDAKIALHGRIYRWREVRTGVFK